MQFFNKDILFIMIIPPYFSHSLSQIGNAAKQVSQFTLKSKLEISIGHCGNCSLKKQLSCSFNEQTNIYNYSGESNFIKCPCENKIINYYKELLPFYKQGIQHFKIIAGTSDLNAFNINIIKSFVKPEFQGECINGYYKTIIKQ